MSIAVGILPHEQHSVILATDTKYTAQTVYYSEKVFPLPPRDHFRVVVAAVGEDANFMKMAAENIDKGLPQTPDTALPIEQVCKLIENQNNQFYKTHVLPLVKAKVDWAPEYSLLTAVWCAPDQLKLLKF